MASLRSPICTLLAHVDHGKTSILDRIRGTAVANGEAGGITQTIGASILPYETLANICGSLLSASRSNLNLPGILFIDSPGHEAFSTLRKRGGSLADIAILVVDISEGLKPQTKESIEILRNTKTPFVVAANKVDLISGWQTTASLHQSIKHLPQNVLTDFETKLYTVIGQLQEEHLPAERYDHIQDYTKSIAVVPTSAKTGQGIPELLAIIIGLAQKYLETHLHIDTEGHAKGTVLEIKDEKGLGKTVDSIIYDGHISVNDTLVIGTLDKPIVTKIRCLLQPNISKSLDKKQTYVHIKRADAATGVKIGAPDLDNAIAGMPLTTIGARNKEDVIKEIQEEVSDVLISTEKKGIVIKADTLGGVEALIGMLNKRHIPIKRAGIGPIIKKDLIEASANLEKDPLLAVVLGFNVPNTTKGTGNVTVFTNNIIYQLLDTLEVWQEKKKLTLQQKALAGCVRPMKLRILRDYIFRQSNPAIVGVDVLAGTMKVGMSLMNQKGIEITQVKAIQQEQKSVPSVDAGKQVAVSLPGVTVGRQIHAEDVLYSSLDESTFRLLKKHLDLLQSEELGVLKEIVALKREYNPLWGV